MMPRIAIAALTMLAVCGSLQAKTDWAEVGEGRLEIKTPGLEAPGGAAPSVCPLRHTDVRITVRGMVADVTVRQEFHNPVQQPIEAEYVFPLPDTAAVHATEMRIGERVIRGKIARRQEARRQYEQARDAGQRASLLEQERPNIFTQSVANIPPGESVIVVIRYVETLAYSDGAYEVVFPMVVGPRYIPGRPTGGRSGHGRIGDTDQVPDASRITPPALKGGQRCGHDISLAVDVEMGVPIQSVGCRAHEVTIERDEKAEGTARVQLNDEAAIPNKDFVLNIATAGQQPEIGLLTHHDGESGYFMLVLQPPEAPPSDQVRPREVLCVMDCSGSMEGPPIAIEKKAVKKLLETLRPADRFNVLAFSEFARGFREGSVPATPGNILAAKLWVDTQSAKGGTEMLTGVRAALATPPPAETLRIVAFFTDGYIGNDWAVVGEVQNLLGDARLFSFGVGSSVNRFLIDRMAMAGRGVSQTILLGDKPDEVVQTFADRLARPVLTDVHLEVTGATVHDVTPARPPDVFAGAPIYLHGRYDEPGAATFEVIGRIGTKPRSASVKVQLPGASKDPSPLPSIWARQQIKQLELQRSGNTAMPSGELVEQITRLALKHSLMTAYTSFVAIDETPGTAAGPPRRIAVAVPVPEGVSYETTVQNPQMSGGGGSPLSGPSFPSLGGGPVGPVGLAAGGLCGLLVLLRRRRRRKQ